MSEPPVEVTENSLQKDRESLKKLWVPIDIDWLQNYFKEVLRWNKRVNEHHPFTIDPLGRQERVVNPGDFLVATGSSEKLRLISEIVQEHGGSVQPAAFTEDKWQSDAQREAQYYGKSLYPLTVAEGKLLQIQSQIFAEGKAAIATDVVVVGPRGRILEKPEEDMDLSKILKLVSGQQIRVMVGTCVLVPLTNGVIAPGLSEGAQIAFRIRDLTGEEIASYAAGDNRTQFAAGIDFSSKSGQGLIDESSPVAVSPLKNTIYEKFCKERGFTREPVSVDAKNIGTLADYFCGAPKDIISVLMRQSGEIQRQIEII